MNIGYILDKIKVTFLSGHERSVRANKNIALSFFLKVLNVAIQFLFVPILLGYLSPIKYGVWVTIGSVINWLYFFDVGLGNGLRNRLAEALSNNEKERSRILVSTTYAILCFVVAVLYLLFIVVNHFVSWEKIFNTPSNLTSEVNTLVVITFSFFSINFVAQLINNILNAVQKSATYDAILTTGNFLSLIAVYIISKTNCTKGQGSIVAIGAVVGICTVLPSIFATVILFKNKYSYLKPSIKCVKLAYFNDLTTLSFKFFVIQVAGVVIFTTDNIIITQLFGPADVTVYNISQKYFYVISMLFSIITSPFWSAFTEAYVKGEIDWIKRKINQFIKIWVVLVFIIIGMAVFSNGAVRLWIGHHVNIPLSLTVFMSIFVVISTWNNIFTGFINGVSKINVSVITALINIIINIPMAIFFAKTLNMGISGVVLANCISLGIGVVLRPMQYYKIINNHDTGIWGK